MNNDLISREDLKKAITEKKYPRVVEDYIHGYNDGLNDIIDLIDNAPTINTTCPNCDSGYAQGYSDGYLIGKEEIAHGQCIKCGRETSGVASVFDDNDNLTQKVYLCSECWENSEPFKPVKFTDDIAADLSRLKAENNRLTAELERVYELYNGLIASKQEQPRKGCPFGDQRETCAEFRANGCDLCKLATS